MQRRGSIRGRAICQAGDLVGGGAGTRVRAAMARPFTTAEIRDAYLSFFAEKGCVRYPSASLVPENDPTTLFTVAGMSQFKDMFLGRGSHPFTRATTVQKCIRTNDIMNVGRTARHHTFFEMLGNFSFNDYFKRETIHWAWEFLTKRLELDPERLSITVHTIDDEAYRIWREEIGIPAERLFKLGDNDNFWPANAPSEGIEGPGGCCSEIFWDHRTNNDPNDNLTSSTGRFVEIWNLVFPEFNVRKPNADGSPNLENLGRTNIDTGSGLERVAAVLQGVYNNFDTDVFQTIIRRVCEVSGRAYDQSVPLGAKDPQAEVNALIRRIADHVRAVTFCVADGALPGPGDRGYIVRRLIRRATLDLEKLGVAEARLHEVVGSVVEAMGVAYPEIKARQGLAADTLKAEEQLFRRTLRKGLDLFQRSMDRQKGSGVFSGDDAFELVATHGFPKEVIAELAANDGLVLDEARFKARWEEHQRVSTSKGVEVWKASALQDAKPRLGATPFIGYGQTEAEARITLIEVDGKEAAEAATGTSVRFALDRTPFYAESGGQVGDTGVVLGMHPATREAFAIAVRDVQKDDGLFIHTGVVQMGRAVPGTVKAKVEAPRRAAITRHHSATHLLHSALTRALGDHVEQQGSKVSDGELRFDFNHPKALTKDEIAAVEGWVNAQIAAGLAADIRELPIEEAKALGAKAQFGEKYGATVRVVTFGDGSISREFCGGCHVAGTGEIRTFKILSEAASSAGIRRIVAVAGEVAAALGDEQGRLAREAGAALGLAQPDGAEVEPLAKAFKCKPVEVPARVKALADEIAALAAEVGDRVAALSGTLGERVAQLQEERKRLAKVGEQRQQQLAASLADQAAALAAGQPPVVAFAAPGLDAKGLGHLAELVRQRQPGAVIILGAAAAGRVPLLVSVPAALVAQGIKAGEIMARLAPLVGGKGGGRPDLAQGAGSDPARLADAIQAAPALVANAGSAAG